MGMECRPGCRVANYYPMQMVRLEKLEKRWSWSHFRDCGVGLGRVEKDWARGVEEGPVGQRGCSCGFWVMNVVYV